MKAIVIQDYGEPEVLQLETVPDPQPKVGEVVVRLRAAGVNPVEIYQRAGTPPYNTTPLPFTPGSDGAGEIAALGEGAGDWKIGDRVYVYAPKGNGTYAESIACKSEQIYRLPDGVSFEAGAALGVPYATAHRALFGKAGAKAGETVFIHGASGGVGTAAIQLANRAGLTVAGTASDEDFIERVGAKYTFNHNAQGYMSDALGATCGRGFDVIVEMLANQNLGQDPDVLAPFGRIVVIGSRGEATVDARAWMGKDATIYGMTLFNVSPAQLQQIHADLFAGLASGQLQPVIGQKFELADAAAAQSAVMNGESHGKIVLTMN